MSAFSRIQHLNDDARSVLTLYTKRCHLQASDVGLERTLTSFIGSGPFSSVRHKLMEANKSTSEDDTIKHGIVEADDYE